MVYLVKKSAGACLVPRVSPRATWPSRPHVTLSSRLEGETRHPGLFSLEWLLEEVIFLKYFPSSEPLLNVTLAWS